MEFIYDPRVLTHNPNSPDEGIYRFKEINNQISSVKLRHEGESNLMRVHSPEHVELVRDAARESKHFAYMQNNPETYAAACLSVGLTVEASKQLGFALGRPPGHHASRNIADGYCLFNNIVIASRLLTDKGAKVAIVDFDAHHGDGTQREVYGDASMQYYSIHEEGEWPFTGTGKDSNCYNLSIPKCSGDEVLLEWANRVQDSIDVFNPDYIGISAGFDGFEEDRVAHLKFTSEGFMELGRKMGELERKTFATLEGGYHDRVYECAVDFIRGFYPL